MQETTADVRRDIEETRARVTQTLAELDGEVRERKEAVIERVAGARDTVTSATAQAQSAITEFAGAHPWYALGAAVGIGLLIGRSGADEAAARKTIAGARSAASGAAGATAGAAKAGVARVKGLAHRDGASGSAASGAGAHSFPHDPAAGAIGSSAEDTGQADRAPGGGGIFYRLQTGIIEAVRGDELLEAMRQEAAAIGR